MACENYGITTCAPIVPNYILDDLESSDRKVVQDAQRRLEALEFLFARIMEDCAPPLSKISLIDYINRVRAINNDTADHAHRWEADVIKKKIALFLKELSALNLYDHSANERVVRTTKIFHDRITRLEREHCNHRMIVDCNARDIYRQVRELAAKDFDFSQTKKLMDANHLRPHLLTVSTFSNSILFEAGKRNDLAMVSWLTQRAGFDANFSQNGMNLSTNPILFRIALADIPLNPKIAALQALLKAGADPLLPHRMGLRDEHTWWMNDSLSAFPVEVLQLLLESVLDMRKAYQELDDGTAWSIMDASIHSGCERDTTFVSFRILYYHGIEFREDVFKSLEEREKNDSFWRDRAGSRHIRASLARARTIKEEQQQRMKANTELAQLLPPLNALSISYRSDPRIELSRLCFEADFGRSCSWWHSSSL